MEGCDMTEPVHSVHPALWENLIQADHAEVCRRSGAQFDEATSFYLLDFLRERYRIRPDSREIEPDRGSISEEDPSIDLQVILLTYMLNAREIPLADRLVAVGSLKGGKCFFQGPHSFPLDPLIEQYGHDSKAFLARGLSLGAIQENYGDVSLRFPALPRVPVVMIFWKADEEFPPRLSLVFDATVDHQLPLDAIYGLVTEICRRMTV
jgi:hypothetical protein